MVTTPAWTQGSGSNGSSLTLAGVNGSKSAVQNPKPSGGKEVINRLSVVETGIYLPNSPLFGTDGIRGRVGDFLNASLALQVGFWAGQVLKAQRGTTGPIILGQDSRNSSDMLAMALSAGLTSAGLEVWNLGLCPTPCVAYLTSVSEALGGVMISASHNPPGDNGIKFFGSDGTKLPAAVQKQIEAGIRGQMDSASPTGAWGRQYYRPELVADYAKALQLPLIYGNGTEELPLQGMRIVLDLAWGAAAMLAPEVFKALGAEIICLHDRPDGDRINVGCGSTYLDVLQSSVKAYNADMGFAFDGDADRVLGVDDRGRPIDGDYILYLWGHTLEQSGQLPDSTIVATVMSNLGFERAWEKLGGKLLRTPVGDQHVHAEMLRTGSMLGGEQSGHILCRHYGVTGDGVMTAIHLATVVRQHGGSLAQMVDESFQTYPQLLRNVRVEDRDRRMDWESCEPVQIAINRATAAMGDQGRILVRASGTEPLIRVMVEAATAELTNYWTDNLVQIVEQHLAA